jgi:hypothetical protein
MTVEKVVTQVVSKKTDRVYKQSPSIREYFREKARERYLRNCKCSCGSQAVYKEIVTKKKLCVGCLIQNEKRKAGN